MGVGGVLDYLSDVLGGASRRRRYKKKRKQFQTVELRVRMDCDGCELKVRNALSSMKGVKSVEINRKQYKVTVQGFVEPHKVVKRVQATGKKAEIWPYIPYNLVAHPYAAQIYDKKAPAGFVRSAPQAMADPSAPEVKYMNMFNDEDVNACAVM